ncbi:hypothetical protein ACJX0J_008520, partial [Zea mays]
RSNIHALEIFKPILITALAQFLLYCTILIFLMNPIFSSKINLFSLIKNMNLLFVLCLHL